MKRSILLLLTGIFLSFISYAQTQVVSGRMNELFLKANDLATGVLDPWEITYGPDDSLWITESKAYQVSKMGKDGGTRRMILNIARSATFLPVADRPFNLQFNYGTYGAQGGLAGLAIHPDFMTSANKFVYISYIHKFVQDLSVDGPDAGNVADSAGIFFTNQIVRFTYNTVTGLLGNPVSLCDTIPGSNDHNSQRMIIVPVNGVNYLFYAAGDMGAGQFKNKYRPIHAQDSSYYEGKILRFNLDSTGTGTGLSKWIPEDNPFNVGGNKSAVWATGIRNNQGFAYDSVKNILYGSSHGPYSDDEINIIERDRNYGHPLVVGYAADTNYNSSSIGTPNSSAPVVLSETANAAAIGSRYKDPLFSAYGATKSLINSIWGAFPQPNNGGWPSEGWSGLGIYTHSVIPGWKNSLLAASLKWGRVLRIKLGSDGTTVMSSGGTDTVSYFGSRNRFRDMAISPDGKSIYVVMDNSTTSSGPSNGNPIVPSCTGCIQKYTFLGYRDNGTSSSLPDFIEVAPGITSTCQNANSVTINSANSNNGTNLWVPITDTLGNIVAEIYPNGNSLGLVTASVHIYPTATKEFGLNKNLYLRRTVTINVATQPSAGSPVKVRIYLTAAEFNSLKTATNSVGVPSGVSAVGDLSLFKNSNACGNLTLDPYLVSTTTTLPARTASNSYVLQGNNITSFSTFYIASSLITLPLNLISFKGALKNDATQLQWVTENEVRTKIFIVERSIDGKEYDSIGTISAKNISGKFTYNFDDANVRHLSAPVVYYRLRMIDIDAQSRYSNIVKVSVSFITGTISVRPNPVQSETVLDIFTAVAEKADWTLTDINGKVVMQRSIQTRVGDNSYNINISQLPAGMYYLKVHSNTINQVVKVQKL